ncbi:N-glycosyltransferase [bacterium BMS3Abin03]|nr:N-glycosyltransferase [bacterium BMS3Abin03]HDY74912.1 glycosyltransferase family 2 protein [Candidatus Neomarinimicrobiota bacterium]
MRIAIITPVRNEAAHLEKTIECMLHQDHFPNIWIIVNDGSTDDTEMLLQNYSYINFIKVLTLKNRGFRQPGKGVIDSFYAGYNLIEDRICDFDIISKFDGDLSFQPDTLHEISKAFKMDSKLGIIGPTLKESSADGKVLHKLLIPKGMVNGPMKFYRKECFFEIGGLIRRAGWDGVDTVKANMLGWNTGELNYVMAIHLRPTGTNPAEGEKRAGIKYGDVSYFMGGSFWYFILRVIGRSFEGKSWKIGWYMLIGYFYSMFKIRERETKEFRKYLKLQQINNLIFYLKTFYSKFES